MGKGDSDGALASALHDTALLHDALLRLLGRQPLDSAPESPETHGSEGLHNSPHATLLLQAVQQEMKHEPSAPLQAGNELAIGSSMIRPKTLLGDLRQRYESLLRTLITTGSHDLDPALFAEFQGTFASTAFHCSISGCTQESIGFPSPEARDDHEREHLPRLLCTEDACLYATTIGFRTAKEPTRHMETRHSRKSAGLPKFRIRHAIESASNSDHQEMMAFTEDRTNNADLDNSELEIDDLWNNRPPVPPGRLKQLDQERHEKLTLLESEVVKETPRGAPVSIDKAEMERMKLVFQKLYKPLKSMPNSFAKAIGFGFSDQRIKDIMRARLIIQQNVMDATGAIKDYLSIIPDQLVEIERSVIAHMTELRACTEREALAKQQQQHNGVAT